MTFTVSISQVRQNIAEYLRKVEAGHTVDIKDEKRGIIVAQLMPKKQFDPDAFGKALDRSAGVFTAKNHPEWRTKQDVVRWVKESRAQADRIF
ncbi:hypothetical protein HY947_03870 [Candidatus Gottesmanbacteria bacterium]|nr:hypothetical protein [Candidatus Gottesmanbacteria bacterium]